MAERLRVYDEKTRPLIDFYRARGLLRVINAEGDVDEVTRRLARALAALRARTPRARRSAPRQRARSAAARRGPTPGKTTRRRHKAAAKSRATRAGGARRRAGLAKLRRAGRRRRAPSGTRR